MITLQWVMKSSKPLKLISRGYSKYEWKEGFQEPHISNSFRTDLEILKMVTNENLNSVEDYKYITTQSNDHRNDFTLDLQEIDHKQSQESNI